ncbi:MAG: dienelactone hydrolase family protein [Ignavibacterium sp.]
MQKLIVFLFISLFTLPLLAQIQIDKVEYKDGDATLEGFVVYDKSKTGKLPGVIVVHEWTGVNDYVQNRGKQLAELGYVAFVADIYGKGIRPTTPDEAAKQAGIYRENRALMRSRIISALNEIKKNPLVDTTKIAAIGYCFGGGTVLELARSGADLKGVVSFHGNLDTPNLDDAKNIKAKVLVLHGANDPFVTPEQMLTFQKEMRDANVDWQMTFYGNTVHSFTNPASGNDPSQGVAYNEKSDKRSWQAMVDFFNEIFK